MPISVVHFTQPWELLLAIYQATKYFLQKSFNICSTKTCTYFMRVIYRVCSSGKTATSCCSQSLTEWKSITLSVSLFHKVFLILRKKYYRFHHYFLLYHFTLCCVANAKKTVQVTRSALKRFLLLVTRKMLLQQCSKIVLTLLQCCSIILTWSIACNIFPTTKWNEMIIFEETLYLFEEMLHLVEESS